MLQDQGVTGRQLGSSDTNHLIEGEVPGLDGVQDALGLGDELDVGIAVSRRGQEPGRQLLGRIAHVVAQNIDAQGHLGFGLPDELAHLEGECFGVLAA